jgi:diguanylate cyclase (GGDEF)-like protein
MHPLSFFIGFLDRRSKTFVAVTSVGLVAVLGAFGYFVGVNVSYSLFYVIPIVAVTWYVNKPTGYALAGLSAAVLFIVAWFAGRFLNARPVVVAWNEIAPLGFFLVIVGLISMLKDALSREEFLSRTDPLTGLLNRRYFNELVEAERNRVVRFGHPITLAYMDLDDFKEVNDRHGHDAGDALLFSIAELLRGSLRRTDAVARLGGDEFAVMMPETDAERGARAISKLREAFEQAMSENDWPVSASIGLVTFEVAPSSVEAMIKEADTLMYSVKTSGKNDVRQAVIGLSGEGSTAAPA